MAKQAIKIEVNLISESDKTGIYDVQGSDNSDHSIWFGSDRVKKPLPNKGDVIVCFENEKIAGQLNYWKIDEPQESGGDKKAWSGGKAKSDFQQRDSYWKDKQRYEEEFRDVEIRYQTYLQKALDVAQFCALNDIPLEFTDAKGTKAYNAATALELFQWAGATAQSFIDARDTFLDSKD